ncbi:hypothetical protein JIX56_33185 [Streptomyces sp. CA-210063]|uniref:hypothetical protein n=1 Tax=Streptomyces sp. CA-210063 TaxID=2801029 RepID=UPI00214BE17E|nr:hypothetical protein [Streptomyces sp. CA-210063]UUU34308.1 hypothetical protein JIX56_33185 [Streptomyces sp. CA-210063]
MGVIDSQWWGLWWPWLVVWALTAACCAVLARYALLRLGWPRRRRRRVLRTNLGMCFYLHNERVMNIYQAGGFSEALEQEVADQIKVNGGFGLWSRVLGLLGFTVHRDVAKERVTKYLRESTPIMVIRLLMDTMRKEDVVVDADLVTGRLVPNGTLAETLRDRNDTGTVPLSAVMTEFVSVTGLFTAHRTENGDVVLRARYEGSPSAHVKITCDESEGRGEFRNTDYHTGEFQARCLGKVRTWNRETGELALDPIAIFR